METNIKLSTRSKDLLAKVRGGAISMAEFLQECAYWALMDGWNDIRPKPYPTASRKIIEYEHMPLSKRSGLNAEFFRDFPEINEYFHQKILVKAWNRDSVEWLKEIKKYIPANDQASHVKIDDKLKTFGQYIANNMPDEYKPRQQHLTENTYE